MTSTEMTAILDAASTIAPPDSDQIEERRANTSAALFAPLTDGTVADWDELGGRPALRIRHVAANPGSGPTVLYLHGGAFEAGSPTDYQGFCSRLAMVLDATVVAPDYRLAPEHPFPAAVDDCLAAYRALLDTGQPPSSIAIVGDSAGGGLVLSCLIAAQRAELPQPAAGVSISAWADLTLESSAYDRCAASDPFVTRRIVQRAAANYLAGTDPRHPLASPVFAPSDELSDLAPILLQGAANEVLADDSTTMADRIALAGGDVTIEMWPEAFHVWHVAGDGVPEARDAVEKIRRFIEQRWTRP